MKLAVVKPDHLGDLVLSSPAIRALVRAEPSLTLFVASRCRVLAQHFFPGVDIRALDLPHLNKTGDRASVKIPDLTEFDLVAFLRRDGLLTPEWAALRTRDYIMPEDNVEDHQSILDYAVAAQVTPGYNLDDMFYNSRLDTVRAKALAAPQKVGFSIGSGFFANAWPLVRWLETGRALQSRGIQLSIVGGLKERVAASVLARKLGLAPQAVVIGGSDFGEFLEQIDGLDVVVASDGGTAHLCSLVTPVISLFGPSPINRYVPFGRWNRALSLRLPCSPCCQFAERLVNGCLSNECMNDFDSTDVWAALRYPLIRQQRPHALLLERGRTLYIGLSHRDQARKLSPRAMEAETWAA